MAGKPGPLDVVRGAIAAGRVPPVWLWAGPEDLLKEECFAELTAKLVDPSLADFLVHRYRAGEGDLQDALATCRQIPMMGGRQVVELRDIDALRVRDVEALAAYVRDPAPETALVLTASGGDKDATVRALAALKTPVAVFWPPYENAMPTWVAERFQLLGKRCDTATAKAFLETVRGEADAQLSLRELMREIEKVVLRTGDRAAVSPEDLGVLARHSNEKLMFAVADRVLARDHAGALLTLEAALRYKENSEVLAVALMTRRILAVAAVRHGVDAGLSPDAALQEAGIWDRDRPLLKDALPHWKEPHVRQALRALAGADRALKSSPKDSRVVIEGAIAMICRDDAV